MTEIRNPGGKTQEEIAQLKARLRDTYSEEASWTEPNDKEKKPKKIRCITRAMAEDFSREQVLFSSLIETIFYILFASSCCIYVSSLKSSDMFYMTEAVKQGLIAKEIVPDEDENNTASITFSDISTVSDMWRYINTVFVDTVYYDKYYNRYSSIENDRTLSVLYENVVLGVPRIRQVRVTEDSCEVHPYFRRLFRLCFGAFNQANEDKSTFGLGREPAWKYSDSKITKNIAFTGTVATYTGGGFYLDLDTNGTRTVAQLKELMDGLWITRNTRGVFIHFSLYNTNLNVFANCRLIFELPPTGGVLPDFKFDCVKLIVNYDEWGYFAFICESVFYIFIFIYILQSLREVIYFKWRYCLRFWSYIDCIISGLAISTFIMSNNKRNTVDGYINQIRENPEKYGNIESIAQLQGLHDDVCAITLFFVFIRFFKYLNFNRTMGQLNDTLKKCAFDILGFSIMFFIIFFAYAELGFLLFGSQVKTFRTFGHSMFTLLRTILGDFDYEAIEKAHRVLAPIYFLSYIFLVFFVLLNMFLAIINDTYSDVKTEIAITPTELQMTDYLKLHLNKVLRRFKCFKLKLGHISKGDYNVTANEIRNTLEKCGFTYLEIEMFFARYNINPLAIVTEYDISKLVSELETMTPGKTGETQANADTGQYVEELLQQKQQLKEMETTMFEVASKVDLLIQKLEELGAEKEEEGKEETKSSSSSLF